MSKKVALISGITGQDGSFLAEFLIEKGYEVHGILRRSSSFNTARIEHLYLDEWVRDMKQNRLVNLHWGDMTDSSSLIRIIQSVQPDEIYNLAAQSHVKVSFDVPEYTAEADAVGTLRMLEAVRILGLEKKTKITTEAERRSIALHEAGHASISWLLEYANPLIKVTIVPRGRALGAAWYLPEERQITTKEQMLDEMCATLGGRAAEDLFLGRISTGAMNDLERVTKQAYGMIAYLGMSDKLPNLCYYNNDEYSFNRPYSEKTAELIDEEVKRMVNEQYDRAKRILSENKEGHNELTQLLIDKEVIFAEDVERIFGKRPWASRSEEIMAAKESQDAARAERELAQKLKEEEKEIKEEEAENTAKEKQAPIDTKVAAEGKKVTVEDKVTVEGKSNEEEANGSN